MPNGDGTERGAVFLLLSLAIHIILALTIMFYGGPVAELWKRVHEKAEKPIVVDVIELPPSDAKGIKPEKYRYFADRDQSVEKEVVPEQRPRRIVPPAPALPAVKGAVRQGAKSSAQAAPPARPVERPAEKPLEKTVEKQAEEPAVKAVLQEKGLKDAPAKEREASTEAALKRQANGAPAAEREALKENTAERPVAKAAQGTARAGQRATEGTAAEARPELFPSDERISQLAENYVKSAPEHEKGKTLQLNTSELRYQKYLLDMKRKIEFRWEYPEVAAMKGLQGILRIDFVIKADGSLGEIKLAKSSNYPVLDDAAITAIRLAAPFPPFPENFGIEQINIKAQFEYLLYGRPSGARR